MLQKIILWLVLVGVVVTGWLLLPSAFWQYVFFLRIPLLMGVLLIALPFLATGALKSMLKNLFVLRGAGQIALTILGATVAGTAVTFVVAIILGGAPARFGVPELPGVSSSKVWYYVLAIALALPTTLTVFELSQEEMDNNKRWSGLFLGVSFGVIFLFLFKLIQNFLSVDKIPGINKVLVKAISFLTQHSSKAAGYIDNGILNNNHFDAIVFFIVLVVIYIIAFKLFMPSSLPPDKKIQEPPALLYVMLLISVSVLLLGSLTFFFDYSRISVLFFWVLIAVALYRLLNVDHYFTLKDAPEQPEEQKNLTALLQKRLDKQDLEEPLAKQTVVVVCASGGGIQAAGWTAQVLTGLQEELGESFTKAIGLISSVSGGSVGAMYYLDRFTYKGFPPTSESEKIFEGATANSLDAVGWGLAYPDLWRVIFLPFLPDILTPKVRDRGIAIEKDWQGRMKTPESPKTLADWRGEVEEGNIPLPVLNATLVDNGWRLLVTPAKFPNNSQKKFFDFNSLYPGKDIDVVTGARLSATFPYISPICRADDRVADGKDRKIENYHVADGGYFDNSGFVTALEWLEELLREKPTQKGEETTPEIKRILILQINPFPETKPNEQPKKEKKRGLFMATIGPLLGLFKVRRPILTSRNLTEVELLQEWESAKQNDGNVEIEYFPIFFPSITEEAKLGLKTAEQEVTPDLKAKQSFYSAEGEYEPPLSWKLTKKEKDAIRAGWKKIVRDKESTIEKLKNLWLDQWNMK
ncbi:patatin-like phospholipase family protein [Okeania hirsuta]|uniref:Patatin-like phospholipase family protein n=1 Tax=Okeania hirsuta TaxID=1458930 RepID=A0A3N6QT07_9CYAN|nr:patatin-like phospholipase family protein [Okeania hirsuta]RQH54529.1 patatin-like phospholipase family protein [Okeania hirsuta]